MVGFIAKRSKVAVSSLYKPQPRKEELAFALRRDFEDAVLRIPRDPDLRADLRALKKEVTPSGKLRFIGETANISCDRT